MQTHVPKVVRVATGVLPVLFLLIVGGCNEDGPSFDGMTPAPTTTCGNGVVTAGEQCDDGNTLDGDCCSATCQFEAVGTACDDLICSNGDALGSCNSTGVCVGAPPISTGSCIAFLSSGSYKGDFGGLAGADAICQRLADEEGLPGTYKAWLSDSQTSAADRLSHSIVPYVRVDGLLVALNWQALTDGNLDNAIAISEGGGDWYNWCKNCFAVPGGCGSVWTATAPAGFLERNTCSDWSTEGATAGTGIYCQEDSWWTRYPGSTVSVDCHHSRSLYCLQQ